ncbi:MULTISPECIES: hypothetical protein [Methylobacillus]|uniref:Uncharacterized protein n=1 Tax=Methylobacillus flagellatus (strain ATCC 51484 / DSM 6875 / VKM B-1610 / KT) TaxID=265072 RepID=Q1GZ92_METFK|nr:MULTISPECIES: hypothetical protein [Methylobacillus]ABE50445.1 hypothetical protein Mfla_2178 [Methylobacillus flagellatus KT]MPS49931.1 hypothetical protein [Methylobacillus sp.]
MVALLIGAVACITALILSAWLMTFAKWFPIKGVDEFLIDYKTMIRAHIDYALMALFGLGFYGLGIPLPAAACICLAVGGFTNPTIFTIAAFDTDFWSKKRWKVFTALSFIVSTIGFMWIAFTILVYAINTL